MPSRKIVQINNEEVFENLFNGENVIAYDFVHDTLIALAHLTISSIKKKLEDNSYIFFILVRVNEEQEETDD